jgi:anti-sigma B factor antagonist
LNLRADDLGGISVIFIEGNVLQETAQALKKKLQDLAQEGKIRLVLDLNASDYISSTCLSIIAEIKKKVNGLGGDLKLSRPNKLVRNLLEATNLIKVIETFNDVDAAVKSFAYLKK